MEIKKAIKIVLGAIATILLGAIGSGVWEKVLSPGLIYVAKLTTSLISLVSESYSNSIYERASNIPINDETATIVSAVILLFIFMVFFAFVVSSQKNQLIIKIFHRSLVRMFTGWRGIIIQIVAFYVLIFLISAQVSVIYIQRYSTKQMEILRPYIGEHKYHSLKSEFLQIHTKSDFNDFLQKIEEQAKKYKVKIDKFKNV